MSKPRKVRYRIDSGLDARLGSLLRQRRQELGLTQSALGDKLDLTFQQIQKYESGTNQLSVGRLLQICRMLNTPVDYFLDPRAVPVRYEPVDHRVTRALCRIRDRRVKQALLDLAKSLV